MRRTLLLFLLLYALSGFSAHSGSARLTVEFASGESLLVERIERGEGVTVLVLHGGGRIGVAPERISRVTEAPAQAVEASSRAGEPTVAGTPAQEAEAPATHPGIPGSVAAEAPGTVLQLIQEAAARHQVDAELLRCLIQVESAYDPQAVSPKGARGLAQLMPGTASDLGVGDPFDPAEAVDAAARHLKGLLSRNGGEFVPALAAYNAGEGAVRRYGGLPPYEETIRYIEKILSLYASP